MTQTTPTTDTKLPGNRRTFLKSASLLTLAAPALLAGQGRVVSKHFQLLAESVINMDYVIPPPDVVLPPGVQGRFRVTFPLPGTKNVLAVQIFIVPEGLPLPLPEAPPLVPQSPADPFTISYFEVEIADIQIGASPVLGFPEPLPSFLLSGATISNPVLSPFGDLTGAPCALSASFQITNPATGEAGIHFLAGSTAGSHTTIAPTGRGFVQIGK